MRRFFFLTHKAALHLNSIPEGDSSPLTTFPQTGPSQENEHLSAALLTIWYWDGVSLTRPSHQQIKTVKCRRPKPGSCGTGYSSCDTILPVTMAVSTPEVIWIISHNALVFFCLFAKRRGHFQNSLPVFFF